jgi:SSS family transporter
MFTAYQLVERRFGPRLRSVTAGLFLATRAAAEGVRVFAVSIIIGIAVGTGEIASIAVITVLTLFYTFEGGMAAVIWTDVVQLGIYIGGTLVGFFTILHLVPGGWAGVHVAADATAKLRIFDFSLPHGAAFFTQPYTFLAGLIGGTFLTTASHGTDQLMVQRLLSARNRKQSTAALLSSGLFILGQFALFLVVGVMLYAFYRGVPSSSFGRADRIFPTFVVTVLPRGLSGLLIAAILAAAMSNLSAALNSLSSSSVVDFYLRWRPQTGESARLRLSRFVTIAWGIVLFGLALVARRGGRVVEVGLAIAGVAYGALLGVFLLGVLTRRASQNGAIVGMICGFAVELYVWLGTRIAYTWYVVIGTLVTFAIGYSASLVFRDPTSRATHA